jgi:hypothetical protein
LTTVLHWQERDSILLVAAGQVDFSGSASNYGGLGKVEGHLLSSKTYGMSALRSS